MRMKILILSLVVGFCLAGRSSADSSAVGLGAYESAPQKDTGIYYHVGALNFIVPWENPQVTYLFDFQARQNLVGGEMPIASIWKLLFTAGAVTSLQGKGAPFVGANLELPNPVPQFAALSAIKPGAFGGYNFNSGEAMFGLKASVSIFQ